MKAPISGSKAEKTEAIDARLVRKLADILNDTGLTDIEVEHGDLKIKVSRQGGYVTAPVAAPVYAPAPVAAPAAAAPAPAAAAEAAPAAPAARKPGSEITSPMVGTVYLSPSPEAEPFVKIGAKVTEGQTLLIIEAMKTMNPIPAPKGGVVVELLVSDAQPVEFGEPLVIIE